MLYRWLRSLLFKIEPEKAHHITLGALTLFARLWPFRYSAPSVSSQTLLGLKFPNPIGLAAGLDKNGEYLDGLALLGFGFIEIGTTTPRPQVGNPKPRLFRLPQSRALINRMGFNNQGVDALIHHLKRSRYRGILGINIGKNADTPLEQAASDYLTCLHKVHPYASYITVNISSPNTQDLRNLQKSTALEALLSELMQAKKILDRQRPVPLLVKIAPDLSDQELQDISALLLKYRIDGVIATNTSLARPGVTSSEKGGLSGPPLQAQSTHVIKTLRQLLGADFPIIGVGGIEDASSAQEKLAAGANLIQLYTGLIYQGPCLVKKLLKQL